MLVNLSRRDAFGPLADDDTTPFDRSRQSSASTVLSADGSVASSSNDDKNHEIAPVLPDDFFEVLDRVRASLARAERQAKSSTGATRTGVPASLLPPAQIGDPEQTPRPPNGAFEAVVV